MLAVLPTGHGKSSLRRAAYGYVDLGLGLRVFGTWPFEFDLQFTIGIYGDKLGSDCKVF